MSNKLYRVVEATYVKGTRTEVDIGCDWKKESAAKTERRELELKHPARTFSLQLKDRKK